MANSKKGAKGTRKSAAKSTAKAAKVARRRTAEEGLDDGIDRLVEEVNGWARQSSSSHQRIARRLFHALFGDDFEAAVDPEARPTRAFLAMTVRAGHSLMLSRTELSQHVRVGAVGWKLAHPGWDALDWSKQRELLPLVAADKSLALLRRGVRFAERPKTGVAELVDWVRGMLPEESESAGRPRGMGAKGALAWAAMSAGLRTREGRDALVRRIAAGDEAQQRQVKAELKATHDALGELLESLKTASAA